MDCVRGRGSLRAMLRSRALLFAGAVCAAAWVIPSAAHAQDTSNADEKVSPTAKGVVGGAFLGAEVVMLPMAIAGVRPVWPYLVFGGAGAVGGGIGGYFIEKSVDDGRVPLYMLAGGLALVLPTVVLTLNATRYRAAENYRENQAPTNVPAADPGSPGGAPVRPATPQPGQTTPAQGAHRSAPAPTGSLVAVREGSVQLGLPIPEVRPVFSARQRAELGVKQETQVQVPVVHFTF